MCNLLLFYLFANKLSNYFILFKYHYSLSSGARHIVQIYDFVIHPLFFCVLLALALFWRLMREKIRKILETCQMTKMGFFGLLLLLSTVAQGNQPPPHHEHQAKGFAKKQFFVWFYDFSPNFYDSHRVLIVSNSHCTIWINIMLSKEVMEYFFFV